jgi:hypothetical protein
VGIPVEAELDDPENWTGGWYELAVEIGPRNDSILDQMLAAIWRVAQVQGCYTVARHDPLHHVEAPLTLTAPESSQVHGSVLLPSGHKVVCASVALRSEHGSGSDWLDFGLPLGCLAQVDHRIGGFPFNRESGPESLNWRRQIDEWLCYIAIEVLSTQAFEMALVGFEALAELDAREVSKSSVPETRPFGILMPGPPPLYYTATY